MVKKILVSQPQPTSDKSPYFDIAAKYDVEVVFRPFIKVERISAKEFRQQRIDILNHTAIVFNSRHAIDHFFGLCKDLRVTIPEDLKYFGISESVALYIQKYVQYRKRKVFFGATGKWPELITVMTKHKTEHYLVPQSDIHNDDIQEMLNAKGLNHTESVMYRTVSNDFSKDESFDYDMLVFFTPSGIQSLLKNFPKFQQGNIRIAVFGESTAKTAEEMGLRIDVKVPSPQATSMTGAIDLYLEEEIKVTN
ncbi:MAG: uroporphyrinogen-III synthase [Bacteroidaceae bacterium]